jgi:hypothetical protein
MPNGRAQVTPRLCLFKRAGNPQHQRLGVRSADDLEADGQPSHQAAGHRGGRKSSVVRQERVPYKRRPEDLAADLGRDDPDRG